MNIPGTYLDATLVVNTARPTVVLTDVRDRPLDKRDGGYGLAFPAEALPAVLTALEALLPAPQAGAAEFAEHRAAG